MKEGQEEGKVGRTRRRKGKNEEKKNEMALCGMKRRDERIEEADCEGEAKEKERKKKSRDRTTTLS